MPQRQYGRFGEKKSFFPRSRMVPSFQVVQTLVMQTETQARNFETNNSFRFVHFQFQSGVIAVIPRILCGTCYHFQPKIHTHLNLNSQVTGVEQLSICICESATWDNQHVLARNIAKQSSLLSHIELLQQCQDGPVTQPIDGQFLQEESNTVDRNPTRIFDLTMAQCFSLGPVTMEARINLLAPELFFQFQHILCIKCE